MVDELNEMGRSNPITPAALDRVVAVDRQELFDMLEADSRDRRPLLRLLGGGSHRSANRVGYMGATVAAAAAIIIGFVLLRPDGPPAVMDEVETAEEITPTTPLVVEDPTQGPIPGPTSSALDDDASSSGEPDRSGSVSGPVSTSVNGTGPTATTDTASLRPAPASDGPFDPSIDLLSLHYDHVHLDDGHSAAAALEIATAFDLQTHVVSGTHGSDFDGYVHEFEPVMRAVWGDEWVNAHSDRSGALSLSVDRWLATLDAGGRVWVAEGGVSDFTADVVREIRRQRPDLDTTTAIHVVQHSGRNESESTPENLRFVEANTAYERIDDGNAANGTADLNQRSDAFESAARAGRHGAEWSAAFEYLPATELDFSDTVEVLHIVGVGIDEVADPEGFARRFLG